MSLDRSEDSHKVLETECSTRHNSRRRSRSLHNLFGQSCGYPVDKSIQNRTAKDRQMPCRAHRHKMYPWREREVIAYTLIQDTANLNDKDSNPWGYYGQAALQKSSSNAISINLTIHWPTLNQTPRKQTNIDVNSAVVSLPLTG